ncbi:MAG TPA: HEAT repeat domain-containing protein [Oscillatoriales cyanobacterium M59_W2019_021]|nr:MAG: HEAT repeat domain-containing protein [Cyanobacteria bacterium J055]HIK32166.1 HEAT repeat domain-containing protein [Oscillatoriales cyanobacterium M4454_W2019_049]HIK51737.1 HEAT repeat domain-containing protein [Oscillatoriales cyanobacterium M59_W2019_021]
MTITPESVRQSIESDDYGERLSGVTKLGHLDPEVAFPLVQSLVNDPNPRVRYSAVSKLATLGTQDLAVTLELLRDRLYNDSELDVKAAAADALGALKIRDAFDDLEKAYHQTSDWILRLSIVAALGEMGEPRAFDILQDALQSDEDLIVGAAIGALGEFGDDRAIDLLLPLIDYDDWQIRFRLAQALGRFQGESVTQALQKLAADPSEPVSQEAQRFLVSG